MNLQSRSCDIIDNPDLGFVRESVIDLKHFGKCYAYSIKQVNEIQKLYEERYNKKLTYKKIEWYYVIEICK